MTAHDCST